MPRTIFISFIILKIYNTFHYFIKDGFIGFGGNVVREKVKKHSDWFVNSFEELIAELNQND